LDNPFKNIVVVFWPEQAIDPIPMQLMVEGGKLTIAVSADCGTQDEYRGLALLDNLQGVLADQLVEATVSERRHPQLARHRLLPDAITLDLRPEHLKGRILAPSTELVQ
jgi:hypothetical protein